MLLIFLPLLHTSSGEEGPACAIRCSSEEAFVCGSNGVSYLNECELLRADCETVEEKIEKVSEGLCPEKPGLAESLDLIEEDCRLTPCPYVDDPLCGSDGRTYSNECTFKNAVCFSLLTGVRPVELEHEGECERPPFPVPGADRASCMRLCTLEYAPLCGNDGVTYSNKCMFEAAACEARKNGRGPLLVAHGGECRTPPPPDCPTFCTLQFDPQCGSDGVTYSNPCVLSIASCENPEIELAHEGACQLPGRMRNLQECSPVCTREFDPVCGSDGKTYANPCLLDYASCKDASVTLVQHGPCPRPTPNIPNSMDYLNCRRRCPRDIDFQCGSDGRTYVNVCGFEIAQCMNPDLTLKYEGACV